MCLSVVLKSRIDTDSRFTNIAEYHPLDKTSKVFYYRHNSKISIPSKIIGYKAVAASNGNGFFLSIPSNYTYGEELDSKVVPVQNENQIYMSGFHVIPRLSDIIKYIRAGFLQNLIDIYMVELSDITSIGFERSYHGIMGFVDIPCYVGNKMKILRKCLTYDISYGKIKSIHEKL